MLKNKNLLLILLFSFLFITGCTSINTIQETRDGTLVIGEVYTLASDQVLFGDVVVIGSSFTMEEGATIHGHITLIGSTTAISGKVIGDIFILGGSTTLTSSAAINGNIDQLFHEIDIEPGADILGTIDTYSNPFAFRQTWKGISTIFPYLANPERVLTSRMISSIAFCLLACLITYLLPKPTQNSIRTIRNQPGTSWGIGFLALLLVPLIILILAITICLAPIALVLAVLFMIAMLFGWIALATIIGEKFNQWFYLRMAPVLQTLVGSMLISVGISLLTLIPCLGIAISMLMGCYGLGGVIISRFGKIEDQGDKRGKRSSSLPTPGDAPQIEK
jgi:cytoskeletal protein CcmA (bactofilin family)